MKKIINNPETVVIEMCSGMVLAHPEMEFIRKYKIVKKREINKNKVSLICGGGSGHEPAHAGFVGKGMLDAAVCGDVFASPSQIQIYQAIRAAASDKGTLLIIKNYTGDVMNFRNAAYLAETDGILVDYVQVNDDIAVTDSLYTVGRRGVAGTVFVHKIAGAAAERGMDLAEVKIAAQKTIDNVRSIGFAFSSCTVPAKGTPTFDIGEGEMEYGVGIHGEPGIKREKIISADELAERMVGALTADLQISENDEQAEVALLINGFGSTPLMELYLLNNAVTRELAKKKISICRTLVGNFMTSLDMLGASVSILKVDDQLKDLLSDESDTPALKIHGASQKVDYQDIAAISEEANTISYGVESDESFAKIQNSVVSLDNMIYIIDKMSACIIENEVPFCELDSHAGDGDFGMSVAKGFRQLKREWSDITGKKSDIGSFLDACSMVIMEYCGGASGPIWGSAFRAAAKEAGKRTALTKKEFAQMMNAAVKGIQMTGERSFGRGAGMGDKTLIDALIPCADAWTAAADNDDDIRTTFGKAARAAVDGAEATKNIVARMGRAGTVGERSLGYPDAGAHALGVIFTDIAEAIR